MSRADGADAPYWEALAEGRLTLPRCDGCDRWRWPAGRRCGACGGVGTQWIDVPMRATVFSWTRTWHRFGLTESLDLPFTNVLAEIDGCGVRILGLLDDPDRIDPEIGAPLVGRASERVVGDDRVPVIVWKRAA